MKVNGSAWVANWSLVRPLCHRLFESFMKNQV